MDPIDKLVAWVGSPQSLRVHTVIFIGAFMTGVFGWAEWDSVLLVVTTLVSLEAIYLAIFIQITVNRHTRSLAEVGADIDEIEEDLKTIEKDVDEIQEDIEDLEEVEVADSSRKKEQAAALNAITVDLKKLLADIEALKDKK